MRSEVASRTVPTSCGPRSPVMYGLSFVATHASHGEQIAIETDVQRDPSTQIVPRLQVESLLTFLHARSAFPLTRTKHLSAMYILQNQCKPSERENKQMATTTKKAPVKKKAPAKKTAKKK
jgi:hypothetical protein